MSKLIIEGNAVYEIDEECMKQRGNCRGEEGNHKKKNEKDHFNTEKESRKY